MFRKLGGFTSFLSLALCVGVVVLWVRTKHHTDIVLGRTTSNHAIGAAGVRWGILLARSDLVYEGTVSTDGVEHSVSFLSVTPDEFAPLYNSLFDPPTTVKFSFLGFKVAYGQIAWTATLTPNFSAMVVPYWLLVTILVPIILRKIPSVWRRRKRLRKGQCLHCGYDLRASTGRCPECGRDIPAREPAPTAT